MANLHPVICGVFLDLLSPSYPGVPLPLWPLLCIGRNLPCFIRSSLRRAAQPWRSRGRQPTAALRHQTPRSCPCQSKPCPAPGSSSASRKINPQVRLGKARSTPRLLRHTPNGGRLSIQASGNCPTVCGTHSCGGCCKSALRTPRLARSGPGTGSRRLACRPSQKLSKCFLTTTCSNRPRSKRKLHSRVMPRRLRQHECSDYSLLPPTCLFQC